MQLGAGEVRALVRSYRSVLEHQQRRLDAMNVFPVPDGDTGTNLVRTMDAVVDALPAEGADLSTTCRAVADGALLGARGNSGVILSQVLRALTGVLAEGGDVAAALGAAATAARRAVHEPVEGTILTVADAAAAAAGGSSPVEVLDAAREAAADALQRTPEQLPVLAEAGVVDAGAAAFVLLLDAALTVLDGRCLYLPNEATAPARSVGYGGPRYEVTYLLAAAEPAVDALRTRLGRLGESVAVSGAEGRWSCHVHTDDPDAAVAAGEEAGTPSRVEVVDLTR